MTTYQYICIEIRRTGGETEDLLNDLGDDGWELVCSYAHNNSWLILKRPLRKRRAMRI